ncbi:ATP-dependent Zn protease [Vibrio sp. HI00D65]|uniref:ATP-dependent zinc protease family protein n=1 Tax=Vibrio sp. HI00D65 TaxID=1822216 RepID=UPI0007B9BAF2|nr:ATP-dependent zinc protease [Vibrio sp. HI00D65]KZX67933.1 ATP-dependent Zn protease [Vibrio sp. HI00D65]|tara:strand:- start:2108 stop:2845 length:738 start_codon:yes stop_codon:yes gene_type:complete
MFKRLSPIVAVGLLSGCTLTNGAAYHQETLDAIARSETNIANKVQNLELQLSNQSDYIESLEDEITTLSQQLDVHLNSMEHKVIEELEEEPVAVAAAAVAPTSQPTILGGIEKVSIDSIKQSFDARVDTGATTSSLNAVDIKEFERNGKDWVRFHLADKSQATEDQKWIEAPVVRYVKIRQSTTDQAERRAVIELWVKVGKIHEKAQFTLADRSQMSHPVLLGREFIKDIALVDVSKQYVQTEAK